MKIMVALDGSSFSEAVVGPVVKLAQESNAEVYLVRVIDPSEAHNISTVNRQLEDEVHDELSIGRPGMLEASSNVDIPQTLEFVDQVVESMTNEATDYMHKVGRRFEPIRPKVVVLKDADVDEALVNFAREGGVDLIAMASHGRTGIAEMILGSHAHQIMERRVAPVLIVRPPNLHRS